MSGRNLGMYTLQYEKGMFEDRWSWSPTKDDFDRLIDEQDCFEISLREEKKKTQELKQEIRRLKQERKKLRGTISDRDAALAESEERILVHKAEIEELKSKLNVTFCEPRKTLNSLKAVQSVAHRNGNDKEMNNNEVAPTKTPDCVTHPAPTSQTATLTTLPPKAAETKFRKAASLVAQLVQGFEAAAAANNCATNEMIRRRKTIHGCRTVTFSLQ